MCYLLFVLADVDELSGAFDHLLLNMDLFNKVKNNVRINNIRYDRLGRFNQLVSLIKNKVYTPSSWLPMKRNVWPESTFDNILKSFMCTQ